jgi:ubiquinone/menaquinone biosynthesis C-methylase UbiE
VGEDLGFGGEVAGFYHQYRRGYPPTVIGALLDSFGLTSDDVVIDLGCGTGQLTLPMASQVRAVAGVDPEPDMLTRARQAAAEQGVRNATWLLGADTDLPALAALLGSRRAGAVTIGQALHWMDYRELIPALVPLLRPGGGIAVITNGTPMWRQDSPWSRALRGFLEQWLDGPATSTCGTDDASQQRYRDTMTEAGLSVTEIRYDYTDELDFDHLVGGVYSALPAQRLPPPDQRKAFAARIHRAVAPHAPFTEHVLVRMLLGRSLGSQKSPGLRRYQRPEHVHVEVASRRVGIAIDLPVRAGQPVPVRLAPLAHRVMGVADLGDRPGVGRGGDEPARQR